MYAVVHSGGKQYKVQKGEILRVEKLPGEVGTPVSFDRVLMLSDGENVRIGQPVLDDVTVQGHIVEQGKYKKIIVFKYKKRKRYRKKQGHRQQYTAVRIDNIGNPENLEDERLADKEELKVNAELEQKPQALSDEQEQSTETMELEQKPAISDTEETE